MFLEGSASGVGVCGLLHLSAGRKTGTEADLRLYSCGLTPLSAGGGG